MDAGVLLVMSTVAPSLPATDDRFTRVATEVARLAVQRDSEADYLAKVVTQLQSGLPARAAAIWLLNSQGVLSLAAERGLADMGVTRDPQLSKVNIRRLLDVVQSTQVTVHTESAPGDPRHHWSAAVFVPLLHRDRCYGVLQVTLESDDTPAGVSRELPVLEEIAGSIAWSLDWRESVASTAGQLEFWNRFQNAVAQLGRSLDSHYVAAVVVNEGRLLLDCDRLSVVVRRGASVEVVAVTGQDRLNSRGAQTQALAALGEAVMRGGRPLDSQWAADDWPESVTAPMFDHLRSSGARSLRIIPLREPEPHPAVDEPWQPHQPPGGPVFAALVLEQFSTAWVSPVAIERSELYARHAAQSLHHALARERILLLPLRRALGGALQWFRGRRGATLGASLAAGALACAVLACLPATYRVEGRGQLMPAVQRDVFAPRDAEVTQIAVEGGERVETGQTLLVLRDARLDAELLAARNGLAEKRQQLDAQQAEIDEATRRGSRSEEVVRLRGRHAQARVEYQAARDRLETLESEHDRLTLRAPISGTVASFQVQQELWERPVRRGEVLLQIMDEEAEWRLELTVPEHRLGHILSAQANPSRTALPVEFVLATSPEQTHTGTLATLSTRTSVRPDTGAVVDLLVELDATAIPQRRIGSEAVARIDCGRKSLFYVLFGDLVELIQRALW